MRIDGDILLNSSCTFSRLIYIGFAGSRELLFGDSLTTESFCASFRILSGGSPKGVQERPRSTWKPYFNINRAPRELSRFKLAL